MDEQRLADWCREQTYAYWNNQLTSEQIYQMEQLPLWTWRHYLPDKLQKHTDIYIRKWFRTRTEKNLFENK